jgi:hypothetical protein
VALTVPEVAPVDLGQLLINEVNKIVKPLDYDQEYLDEIIHQVLKPLFRTARDIRRFANTLPFVFDVLGDEVAATDLLALEALRTIRPDVAEKLPHMADLLTDATGRNDVEGEKERRKAIFEDFIKSADDDAGTVRELCRLVFPASLTVIDNRGFQENSRHQRRRNRRVAHHEVLRIYLESKLPPGVLPIAVVKRAATAFRQPSWSSFDEIDSEQLESLLKRLLAYVHDFEPERALNAAVQIS